MSEIELVWKGDRPATADAVVIADMKESGFAPINPDRLVFHTVWLSDDMEGPSVLVWGEGGKFHAEYSETTNLEHMA